MEMSFMSLRRRRAQLTQTRVRYRIFGDEAFLVAHLRQSIHCLRIWILSSHGTTGLQRLRQTIPTCFTSARLTLTKESALHPDRGNGRTYQQRSLAPRFIRTCTSLPSVLQIQTRSISDVMAASFALPTVVMIGSL